MKILGISPLKAGQPAVDPAALSVLEAGLAGIWKAVLDLPQVQADDHFFELGGNSLGVIRVAARVRETFGVDVPLAALFQAPTLASMTRQVQAALLAGGGLHLPPLTPAPPGSPPVLSAAQERMWLLHQMDRGGTAFNVTGVGRLRGPLSVPQLEASLHLIVERHPPLRTTFAQQDEGLVARVHPAAFSLPVLDLGAYPAGQREVLALEAIRDTVTHPFDLEAGPVFQARLYRLSDEEHLVLLDLPHINSDAWSMGILMAELVAAYEALKQCQSPRLPDLTLQYSDFAHWQRGWLRGEVYGALRAYWLKRLADYVPLDLPLDCPAPSTLTFKGATESVALDQDLLRRLRQLAHTENATLFMVMLTAFKVLLQRWTGREDVAVGTPMAGRQHQGLEQLVGVFVNTLVLRTDLTGADNFRESLGRVRTTAVEAFVHQDMPFARLIAELQLPRLANRSPVVQVLFNQINVPMPAMQMADIRFEPVELDRGGAQFELNCTVQELPGEEKITLEYNTALFEQATAQRLLAQYLLLLRAMAGNADQSTAAVSLFTPEDQQLLAALNDTRAACPDATLHGLFEQQVRRTPHAAALRAGDQELGYQALNAGANRLAQQLLERGLTPGTPVALFLNRSFESVMAILAVLKAGGAYVPLDPTHPAPRLAWILADAGAPLVITTWDLAAALPPSAAQVLYADGLLEGHGLMENLELPTAPEALAYIIYTSGSTGTPKGVLGRHRGMVNRLDWMWKTFPFGPGEVLCHKTALGFLDSVWEIFGPLLRGVPSVVVPDAVARDPEQLTALLSAQGVTRVVLVPSLLGALLDFGPRLTGPLRGVQLWTLSGEALSGALVSRFREAWPAARLLNLYGSTEVSADATAYEIPPGPTRGPALIGRPIQNMQAYVVDRRLRPVPPGTPGELLIAGMGVAAGYHRQNGLTAQHFVTLPLAPGRCYRTGDLVTLTSAGQLRFLGRTDRQLKIRGVRLEPGEIEAALLRHPAVQACTVGAFGQDQQALTAHLVLRSPVDVNTLRDWMAGQVPGHWVPNHFVVLDALPLTPSGKLDWRALPEPEVTVQSAVVSAQTPLQERLISLWEELLDRTPIGIHDDFFALGGHSLMAMRLVVQIEQRLGMRLPVTAVFQAPNISELARRIEQHDLKAGPVLGREDSQSSTPLFCFHGLGSDENRFRNLTALLGSQNIYHFNILSLDIYSLDSESKSEDERERYPTVEDLAQIFLKEIKLIQPHGPYQLYGYSFGGLVIYELAQKLKALGDTIDSLIIVDTYAPPTAGSKASAYQLADYAIFGELTLLGKSPRTFLRRHARRVPILRNTNRIKQADDKENRILRRIFQNMAFATKSYCASPLDVPAVFFKAQKRPVRDSLKVWTWEPLFIAGYETIVLPGDHFTIFNEPSVQIMSNSIRSRLRKSDWKLAVNVEP
ncbi:non-ribosomal peptide synthetase [Deinococcus marmoris]|uniref:non-ribosomal peptide synthetase n=1 Tax=Deinococcus marmoris TaxID=249408 RepID=UPI00068B17C9|nr:non-ribosomal peptide synthetase [Deinococcus marmoris]